MQKLYCGITRILLSMGILLITSTSGWAISLGFDPTNQTVIQGNQATVDVVVDPMGLFVGTFDDVDSLGTTDSVNVASVSFDFPLTPFQNGVDDVTLFSLTFDTLTVGTSALTFSPGIAGFVPGGFLGDELGFPLQPLVTNGSITVAPVPEPTTWLLLGIGLIGISGLGRKFRKE